MPIGDWQSSPIEGHIVHKSINLLAAAAAVFAVSPIANADDFQISAGGEYIFDSNDTEFAFTGITGRGAYYFNSNIGIEAEGTVGTGGVGNYASTGVGFDLDGQYGAYVVGRIPTGKSGEMFARAGFRAGTIEATYYGYSDKVDYNGFSIGAGYTYFFSDNLGLRGEVTTSGASLDNNFSPDGNLTSLALSLVFKFGGKS